MKGLIVAGLVVVAAAAAVVGVRLYLEEAPQTAAVAPVAVPSAQMEAGQVAPSPVAPKQLMAAEEEVPEPEPASELAQPEQWQLDPEAVQSLRQSMEQGDPRAPPIARRETEREMPTEEELADPDLC